jgi:hypothetical protein
MKYGVQWLDHGGPWNHAMSYDDLSRALNRLGLTRDILTYVGGVQVGKEDFWYIETNTLLPEWKRSTNPYNMNFNANMNRFDESLKLWFYTFPLDGSTVGKVYTFDEYEDMEKW